MGMAVEIRRARIDEQPAALELEQRIWRTFHAKAHGTVGYGYEPELHVVAIDSDTGMMLGTGDACPFDWDGNPETLPERGWQEVIVNGIARKREGWNPRARYACALGVTIAPEADGLHLGPKLLAAIKEAALTAGYEALAAPVRPTFRWRALHLSVDEYAQLRLPDGRHFDPWIRAHERLGGTIIATCAESAIFHGSRDEWEQWVGFKLPENGQVLVEGGNGYLELEDGEGWLVEDSVWLLHER